MRDAAVRIATGGVRSFDRGGALAASGHADLAEVARLLDHPYFRRRPPKSLDRDTFGAPLVAEIHARRPELEGADLVATMTEFVARTVGLGCVAGVPRGVRPVDLVVSGGGVHNGTLMRRIGELVDPLPVRSSAELGLDPDAKEAVLFAVLANEFVAGNPGNLPKVTGARHPVVLGQFVPATARQARPASPNRRA